MILGSAAKQKASSALERIEAKVEQHAGAGMALLLCLLFVALVGLAASDYLWYDELVIVRVAALPHWRDIWNFYASGLDTIGLLYALVLHAMRGLPADEEIRSRLPAIVSFLGMLWCTFVFVRRRYAAAYAFAVVLLLTTFPLLTFAVFCEELRGGAGGAGARDDLLAGWTRARGTVVERGGGVVRAGAGNLVAHVWRFSGGAVRGGAMVGGCAARACELVDVGRAGAVPCGAVAGVAG